MEPCPAPKILRLSSHLYLCFVPSFLLLTFFCFYTTSSQCSDKPHTWGAYIIKCTNPIIPGGFFTQKLIIIIIFRASSSPYICVVHSYMSFLHHYMHFLWLKILPSWVAWLLCLCPTFPLVRLEHKGSTSAIVTTGLSGHVPQTGWSRKLAFLRE